MLKAPVRALPAGYREAEHLVVTEGTRLLRLNILSLIPLSIALAGMAGWWWVVTRWRGALPGPDIPWWAGLALVLAVMPLHEVIHAAAIRLFGHAPRLGAKLDKGILYATADQALFRRDEFVIVALAPLVTITLAGMALVALLPDSAGLWLSLGVVFNAASAIGDLWMVAAVLRCPPASLIRDEADGIRIFSPPGP